MEGILGPLFNRNGKEVGRVTHVMARPKKTHIADGGSLVVEGGSFVIEGQIGEFCKGKNLPLHAAVSSGRPFKRPGWKLGPGGAIPWVSWCILSRKFVFEDGMNQWNPRPEDIMATDYELRTKNGMELLHDFLDCKPEDSKRISEIQDYVRKNYAMGEGLEIPF